MESTLRFPNLALALLLLSALLGCDETKVVYAERVAILPDASGLIVKEVRSDAAGKGSLVLMETVGDANRDIYALPLDGFDDVKFQSGASGDTVLLFHSNHRLDAGMVSLGKPTFPIRFRLVTGAEAIGAGTEEGAAIFYAPEKWKAFLEMSRKP